MNMDSECGEVVDMRFVWVVEGFLRAVDVRRTASGRLI